MPTALMTLRQRLASAKRFVQHGFGRPAVALLPHLIAFAIMLATEHTVTAMTAFVLTWGILSFFWLALTRRPVISGALSLFMMTVLVLLSQLKYHVLMMTPNFVDLMIVDTDTVSFLFMAVAELMTDGLMQSAVFAADRVEGGGHQLESSRCGPFRYSSA